MIYIYIIIYIILCGIKIENNSIINYSFNKNNIYKNKKNNNNNKYIYKCHNNY